MSNKQVKWEIPLGWTNFVFTLAFITTCQEQLNSHIEILSRYRQVYLDPEVEEEALKPIYEDLSRHELLDRCKGSNTQNNESYNGLLWHFSPKHNGFKTIELSNYFATSIFNDGYLSILKIFNVMGVTRRHYESLIIANGLVQKRVDHLEEELLQLNKHFLRKRKVNYMGLE